MDGKGYTQPAPDQPGLSRVRLSDEWCSGSRYEHNVVSNKRNGRSSVNKYSTWCMTETRTTCDLNLSHLHMSRIDQFELETGLVIACAIPS